MFVFSIKLSKAVKVVVSSAVVLALGVGLAVGVSKVVEKNNETTAVSAKVSLEGKDHEGRMKYIKNFGIEVNGEPHQVVEVLIPQEFEGPYRAYNDMLKKQNFDLEKHKGKLCKQWTYAVEKPADKDGKCVVNILVLDNKIVGADVTNLNTGAQQTLEEFGGSQTGAPAEAPNTDTKAEPKEQQTQAEPTEDTAAEKQGENLPTDTQNTEDTTQE